MTSFGKIVAGCVLIYPRRHANNRDGAVADYLPSTDECACATIECGQYTGCQ